MNEREFKSLKNRASIVGGDYAAGYQRGLSRHYHGESFGTQAEHRQWMQLGLDGDPRTETGQGYRDGFEGKPPAGLCPGRPVEMSGGKRRNVYMDDASWERAVALGDGNASDGIRKALEKAS